MKVSGVFLPGEHPNSQWDVEIENGIIHNISKHESSSTTSTQEPPSLLLPSLCHPHIHIDKAYLLNSNAHLSNSSFSTEDYPDYSDLIPSTGTFQEALSNTSKAKTRYTIPDLLLRGSQLIAESISNGVTDMRAYVEIDHVTQFKCIDAAIQLKKQFSHLCHIQIAAFAQDPIFSTQHGEQNRTLLSEALTKYRPHIDVLATTPYVETDRAASLENITWAIETALSHSLHLDFHLDYNLNPAIEPMVPDVIRLLKSHSWPPVAAGSADAKTILLGHCTRLTLLTDAELSSLATEIQNSNLPIHFVGLPTSDVFMMGRPAPDAGDSAVSAVRPRGTLQVPSMIRQGFEACLGVNNVGNAFTPWGNGDPLALASLGIGVYQVGTARDAEMLFEAVSTRARRAIGLGHGEEGVKIRVGQKANVMLVKNQKLVGCYAKIGVEVPSRMRLDVKDVVWDPPEKGDREILRG